jgi:hypothetical protein
MRFISKFALFLIVTTLPGAVFAHTSKLSHDITGHSQGQHRLDCTIIRPWAEGTDPGGPYPVIGWTNGWGQGKIQGANQTENYISGLYYWAEVGDYLVVAANQWSPRAPDIQQCLQWLIDANSDSSGSEYSGLVDTDKIGLSGHSQGGGAALKAGDSVFYDAESAEKRITTVVVMNPYGPSFVKAMTQNGQVLLLGGAEDTVTPTDSYSEVLYGVVLSDMMGGVQAELIKGTHCNPACRDMFGEFGEASLLWWDIFLRGELNNCKGLRDLFLELEDEDPYPPKWNTQYSRNFSAICPPPQE